MEEEWKAKEYRWSLQRTRLGTKIVQEDHYRDDMKMQ
jgi:hypothetical protein